MTAPSRQDPQPQGDTRREEIASRSRQLRRAAVAGSVAVLAVFTGLAATHGGSGASAQPAAGQQQSSSSDDNQRGSFGDDFFRNDNGGSGGTSSGSLGILPSGGGTPSLSSGGS